MENILDQLPQSVAVIIDEKFRILSVFGEETERLGFRKEELVGKIIFTVLPSTTARHLRHYIARVFSGESLHIAGTFREQTYLVHLKPLSGAGSSTHPLALIMANNITQLKETQHPFKKVQKLLLSEIKAYDQKLKRRDQVLRIETHRRSQAENLLLQSNQRLEMILSATKVAVYSASLSPVYRINFITQNITKLTGFTPQAITDQDRFWLERIHPADRAGYLNEIKSLPVKKKIRQEYRIRRKDGSYLYICDEKSVADNPSSGQVDCVGFIIDISEQKQMEENLNRSESISRSIISSAAEGIFVQNADGSIHSFNKRCQEILGLSQKEILQLDAEHPPWKILQDNGELLLPENQPWIKTLHTGRACRDVTVGLQKGKGRVKWLSVNSQPIYFENAKRPAAVVISFHDITQQRLAHLALQASEEKFKTLLSTAPNGIVIINQRKRIEIVNKSALELFGYTADELVGQPLEILIPEFYREAHRQHTKKYFKHPKTRAMGGNFNLYARHKSGRLIPVDISLSHLVVQGKTFVTSVIRDITAQIENEQKLKESEKRYRLLFENDITGDYVSTPEGTLRLCNASFARIFGYASVEEALRQNAETFYTSPEERKNFIRLVKSKRKLENYEMELRKADGKTVSIVQNVVGVFDRRNELVEIIGYIYDLTTFKQMEKQFIQAQKMEAIGKLAGGVAHDFNNLLAVINGYSDLLLKKLPADDPVKKEIAQIKAAGERAASLTTQLLAFSRKQILNPKILNLNRIISNLEKMLIRLIGEDIHFKTHLQEDLKNIKADSGQIDQILINLVVNARDAMPDGGDIIVETKNVTINEDFTQYPASLVPGGYVLISVSDTGTGMDEETRQHIFEPFFTTKEQGKGTGLGLSTVYGIVKQYGGNIYVYSEEGLGTTFKLYFPQVDEEDEIVEEKTYDEKSLKGNETILVVEDDSDIQELLETFLSHYGYKVLMASNGKQGIELFRKHKKTIRLVISDVIMPEVSGKKLAEAITADKPDMPLLFISGYTDDVINRQGVPENGAYFLSKPFSPDELVAKVREMLDASANKT